MSGLREILPKYGMLHKESGVTAILAKPKLLNLKSVTLEKLDKMQSEAEEAVRKQESEDNNAEMECYGHLFTDSSSSTGETNILGEDEM